MTQSQGNSRPSALFVAIIASLLGLYGTVRVGELQRDVGLLSVGVQQGELALDQQRFDAEERARRFEIITRYFPDLVGDDQQKRRVALAVLFELYPNEAKDILGRVAEAVGDETAALLESAIASAETLALETGDWTVVIASANDLAAAQARATEAASKGYETAIYQIGEYFAATVGRFPTREDATRAGIAIRAEIVRSAYVLNLNYSCPVPELDIRGFYACSLDGDG